MTIRDTHPQGLREQSPWFKLQHRQTTVGCGPLVHPRARTQVDVEALPLIHNRLLAVVDTTFQVGRIDLPRVRRRVADKIDVVLTGNVYLTD